LSGAATGESAASSGGTSSDGGDDDNEDGDETGGGGRGGKRRGGGGALRRCLAMPSLLRLSVVGCDALVAVRVAAPKLLRFEVRRSPCRHDVCVYTLGRI
jgi:hypothetical protein